MQAEEIAKLNGNNNNQFTEKEVVWEIVDSAFAKIAVPIRGRLRRRRDCSKMNIQHDNNNKEIDTSVTSSRSEDEGSIKSLSEDSSSDDGPSNEDGEEFTGTLTNYNVEENEGACGGMHTNDEMVAALNSDQFDALADGSSVYCGVCATIHGDKAKILVKIVDECPSCNKGDLDLSPAAFDAATTADGEAHDIMWYFTKC
ncbi:hypothetical protein EV177_006225 [Coemansia sp. RSA 1804]|nr:hypothetical protein EV177_006225 [Coemansia sp. RSA 1804]